MKVNTDGVLLGTAMTLRADFRRLLDIGTGTGTVALIAAQRLNDMASGKGSCQTGNSATDFQITAIDIDDPSAIEAGANFARSPWGVHLSSLSVSLQDYGHSIKDTPEQKLDMIFSNPPYFEDSLKAPDKRRSTARHTDTLSYRDILDFSALHLSSKGLVSMILPAVSETDLVRYAVSCGLYPQRMVRIKTVQRKAPVRIIAEFSKARRTGQGCQRECPVAEETIVIHADGQYTEQYKTLTRDFLLWS